MRLKNHFPILTWLPRYKTSYLAGDLSAGLTVGVLLIPQGMAYAMIAGLPPQYGLYAALVPQVVYALMGTSRQLAVGAVATDSLLVAAGVSALAIPGTAEYIALAILLAFMIGLIQFIFGIFGLGFLVNFLSRPVISGFTSAAALIIGISQIKHLIGVDVPRTTYLHEYLWEILVRIPQTHLLTLGVGLGGILLILAIKKWLRRIPASLVAVILGISLVHILELEHQGLHIVGKIPEGLPAFHAPDISLAKILDLLPFAVTLSLIAFMEVTSVAKSIQLRHKDYQIEGNQELIALGVANFLGSFFQSFPTSGGLSRSAVNDQAGAKTNIASLISALIVALTLLYLTPVFYFLPQAVLASIIIVAALGLLNVQYPHFLWKNKRDEFFMLAITFLVTLILGIREGIILGVVLSLALVIYQSTRPHAAELGYFPGSDEYRNIERFKEVITRKDILVVRYDSSLYFANINHFLETMRQMIARKGKALKLIVFNAESINIIDSSATEALKDFVDELRENGSDLYITGVKGPVRDVMYKTGLIHQIGQENFFLDVQPAIDSFDNKKNDWIDQANTYAIQTNVKDENP